MDFKDFYNEAMRASLVDKIASFFEIEENWNALKNCWLEDGWSEDLRKLLEKAIKDYDFMR